ncbi:glycoside hydrolase family 73 protein, partial [Weissella kandleri]|uniref:glycoside hydrolase family 73 protein n=1 Tax=Weissella kandleri TaxID=1616 RepID=UPI00138EE4C0
MANKLSRFYQSTSIIISASALGMVTNLNQSSANNTVTNFTNRVAPGVKHASQCYNVWGSVMMAQAALESGWGQSQLSIQANNYFGIKGSYNGQSVTMRTAEYDENGNLYYTDAKFKKYPSPTESMNDNGNLLRNGTSWDHKYYSGAWKENADTYAKAAHALNGKYATDPNYATKLISIIQSNNFDKLVDGPVYKAKYKVGQRVQLLNTASYET